MEKIITFPHLGDYYIPISYLIRKSTNSKVIVPPKITKKTLELGTINSPDYVCVPFKYNLGNFIESLELGANVILQAGGGCRYGYYAELQEKILKDLGYKFEFVNFIKNNHVSLIEIYKYSKKLNKKLNILKYTYYIINTFLTIIIMDKLSDYKRKNMAFEITKNSFIKQENKLYKELRKDNLSPFKIIKLYYKYKKIYKEIKINKPNNPLKVGLVGELYTLMEPYSNSNIENILASYNIEIHRFTTLTYLLLQKKFKLHHHIKSSKEYIKYHLGADATESVSHTLRLAKNNYDGIIHIKSFGCTPEINAIPILEKISNDYNIPIIYFSYDAEDNEVAINTRIEAFYDMLMARKK